MARILFLSLITLLLSLESTIILPADAAEDVRDNPFAMSLEQLMQVEITGATLTEKSLKNVPAAVTVFTREEISRLGMDYLHELLNLVPGYQSQRSSDMSTASNYSSRGRRQGANSREVLLLLDGRPMNDARTGGPVSGMRVPLGQIERVEIIRGPGSAIYGSNAFTGIINVITAHDENQASLTTGTDNQQQAELHLSQKSGDWYARLFAHGVYEGGQDYTVHDTFTPSFITTEDPARGGDLTWLSAMAIPGSACSIVKSIPMISTPLNCFPTVLIPLKAGTPCSPWNIHGTGARISPPMYSLVTEKLR